MANGRVIGLTGGIGSGKSTVASLLRSHGAAVVDADAIAREIVEPGEPALAEIIAAFGPGVLTLDGALDRAALGKLVFADSDARATLNAITHPRIAQLSGQRIAAHIAAGLPVVFYEAALIVERGLHKALDDLVVVSTPPLVQRERIMARDGLGLAEAEARLTAQLPLEDKLSVATHIIDNGGSRAETERQVTALWQSLVQDS